MEVEVEGEEITQEELTAERGWHTARSRRRDGRGGKNSSPSASPQTQESCSRTLPKKNVKAQVLKAGRMPPLPKNEIKIILRPKGGLHISKVGSPTVTAAIFHATKMPLEESQEDTICPNVQQNIIVISTPHPHNADRYVRLKSIHVNGTTHEVNAYEAAPDNTTKGVIRGIPLTDTAQEIDANIVNTRNPLALAAKRIGTTTTVVIAFEGPSAPRLVRYGATLIPCSLYRKKIDICYHCGRLGHRMDVCPFPNNKICRGCGSRNPDQDHQCTPKCTLCDGAHPTADKECAAKYKTPYVIRKRLWEQRMAQQSTPQASDLPPTNLKHGSRPRSRTGAGRSGSKSRSRSRSTPGGQAPSEKVSFAEAVQGVPREGPTTLHPAPKTNTDDAAIDQLKKENAGMRELIQKLTQEVENLKQLKTQPIPQVSESLSVTSPEAAPSPAPKKRALQGGATGQVRSEVKDLLVSLQSTVETLHNALLEVAQRVTAMENNLHTLFPPSAPAAITMDTTDVARGVPALPPAASSIPHHGPH
ncbi:hypothetical protein HPB52_012841 [Rhipicephalus sanguineus]|uniref:CCHC-type domain-containing protein n=1 Tax=Rhipicephalus sanguineus TaxID=34632 RepID=A0A9D4SQD9_RHISA|nr:hypothetical protein HPB52_012841 [Rhipicephalus sanguineus]